MLREQQQPRGRREGHPGTRLLDAVDRARAKGKGRRRREIDAERVVAELEKAMLAEPPEGVSREYVRGFFGCQAGRLRLLVRQLWERRLEPRQAVAPSG